MQPEDSPSPAGFAPSASIEMLQQRAELLARVRRFFTASGYWEVETPVLSRDVVVDAHLEPFVTTAGSGEELFLQTSPEFAMKRLLAAGADAVFQIARAFRRGELGRLHNPEFTIIEWYRAGDDHHGQMAFVESLVRDILGRAAAVADGRPFERIAYDAAFERFAGGPVLDLTAAEIAGIARKLGLSAPSGLRHDDRDSWLNLLLAEVVQPQLARSGPVFLYDYPASQAALARVRADCPPVAERFELYIDGIEICNGYHELTDADELRDRIRRQSAIRVLEGRRDLPAQSRLLEAMQAGLPACAGVALGFDRLAMLALGAESLAEVLAFPFGRA